MLVRHKWSSRSYISCSRIRLGNHAKIDQKDRKNIYMYSIWTMIKLCCRVAGIFTWSLASGMNVINIKEESFQTKIKVV